MLPDNLKVLHPSSSPLFYFTHHSPLLLSWGHITYCHTLWNPLFYSYKNQNSIFLTSRLLLSFIHIEILHKLYKLKPCTENILQCILPFSESLKLRSSAHFQYCHRQVYLPGILNVAPLVDVPTAMCPICVK